MPVGDFMGDFFKVPRPYDTVDLLSSRQAFSRVPIRSTTVEDLCTHLVSSGALLSMLALTPSAVDSFEQADGEQIAMPRIRF